MTEYTEKEPRQLDHYLIGSCDEYQFSQLVNEIKGIRRHEGCADELLDSLVGETIKEVRYCEYDRQFNVLLGSVVLVLQSGKTIKLDHTDWMGGSALYVQRDNA